MGAWINERGVNVTDGGAPFYDVYETKDKRYISVAPVEKKFYLELLERIGLANDELPDQNDRSGWDRLRVRLADVFKRRTRDEWCAMLEGTDACFAPVLDMDECVTHPHNIARKTHVVIDGVMNPAPAPRFSETPSTLRKVSSSTGEDTEAALSDWGFSREELDVLKGSAAIR
jgi:alpha-methylacyl-CoA racemase